MMRAIARSHSVETPPVPNWSLGHPNWWPLIAAESLASAMQRDAQDRTVAIIVEAAYAVHRELGPGLLEAAYEACLAYELSLHGILVERQKPLTVLYRNARVRCDYRLNLVVDDRVLVVLKSVERLESSHETELLACLKLAGYPVGLLINFNMIMLANGIRTVVNDQAPG